MMCRKEGLLILNMVEINFIINIIHRFGSQVDVENMKALLQGLEFDVTVHKNLELAQFFKEITEFCCNKMHQEADMTVVVILRLSKICYLK